MIAAVLNFFLFFRWMRKFGFKCPSEKNMRETMVDWLSDQTIEVEMTPFQHYTKKKAVVMVSAPMGYVQNLQDFVFCYLDMLDRLVFILFTRVAAFFF